MNDKRPQSSKDPGMHSTGRLACLARPHAVVCGISLLGRLTVLPFVVTGRVFVDGPNHQDPSWRRGWGDFGLQHTRVPIGPRRISVCRWFDIPVGRGVT